MPKLKMVSKQNYKLSDSDIVDIQRALARGVRGADLARGYGVTPAAISQIKAGIRRPNGYVVRRSAERMVELTLEEAEALLSHLDACALVLSEGELKSDNDNLAMMLQQRIDGEKK